VSIVGRAVDGVQDEVSVVGVLMPDETLADMLEIPIGAESRKLLEVAT